MKRMLVGALLVVAARGLALAQPHTASPEELPRFMTCTPGPSRVRIDTGINVRIQEQVCSDPYWSPQGELPAFRDDLGI